MKNQDTGLRVWEEHVTPDPVPVGVLNASLLPVGSTLPVGGSCIPKSY